MAHGEVTTIITGQNADLKAKLAEGKAAVNDYAASAKTALGGMTGVLSAFGVSLSIAGAVSFGKAAIAEWREGEAASKRLDSILHATGNTTGRTREQMDKLAASIERLTKFEDDAALAAMGTLASFKAIKGDEFDRAVKAAADLAAVMDTDLASAASTVGRALAFPEQASRLLKSANIDLTDAQEASIKNFVELGQSAKAQGVVLDALAGVSENAAERMVTSADRASKAWAKGMENLGAAIGPTFDALNERIARVFEDWGTGGRPLLDTILFPEPREPEATPAAGGGKGGVKAASPAPTPGGWLGGGREGFTPAAIALPDVRSEIEKFKDLLSDIGTAAATGQIDALQQIKQEEEAAKAFSESLKKLSEAITGKDITTPAEDYAAALKNINTELAKGLMTPEQGRRHTEAAQTTFRDKTGKTAEEEAEVKKFEKEVDEGAAALATFRESIKTASDRAEDAMKELEKLKDWGLTETERQAGLAKILGDLEADQKKGAAKDDVKPQMLSILDYSRQFLLGKQDPTVEATNRTTKKVGDVEGAIRDLIVVTRAKSNGGIGITW